MLQDFVAIRPNAHAGSIVFDKKRPVDLAQADTSLQELLHGSVERGEFCSAQYDFRGHRLVSISYSVVLKFDDSVKQRPAFIKWGRDHWGDNFVRELTESGDGQRRFPAPMLVWSFDDSIIRAVWTPDFKEAPPEKGFFLWRRYEPAFKDIFSVGLKELNLPDKVRDEIFGSSLPPIR